MFCRNDGQVTKGGELIDVGFITVRPVLWIFLQKDASSVTSGNIEVGDTITFGTYEQDNNILNGTEEIEWDVLEVQDGKAMIISKYALDCQPYNQKYASVTWETCTLRQWLNQDFLNTAFSVEEQKKIVSTKIANDENPFYGTDGGNDTTDRVFLLSTDEIDQYFPTVEERYVYPTAYAFSQGVWTYDETSGTSYWVGYKEESLQEYHDNASCWWWLRSPGYITIFSMFCRNDGHVLKGGEINSTSFAAVRPVLWIELDEETITAVASPQTLIVDGEEKTIEMYSIYDYNYVKIRDIAALLNGTRAQFSVLYNADTRQIDISTGEPYVLIGNELTIENNPASCVTTSQTIYVNSAVQSVEMFNISGSNYIKLRDLGDLIGFKVDYSAESNQAIITST